MFILECKFEKFWKYVDGSIILPCTNPQSLSLDLTTSNTKSSTISLTIDILAIETLLNKKKNYEIRF